MNTKPFRLLLGAATIALGNGAMAQECGGDFADFVSKLERRSQQSGYARGTVEAFLKDVRQDQSVLRHDRRQGFLHKDFITFSSALISDRRLEMGQEMAQTYSEVFDNIEQEYGVPRGVLLALWALETDFGQVQGDFLTRDALITLAHDCRRPDLFLPQVYAALELFNRGDMPVDTTGAWAGEMGMVQMLPEDILRFGTDADGDGQVSLKTSVPDALTSGARLLLGMGWQPGQPWMQEVTVPDDLDWFRTGLTVKKTAAEWAELGVVASSGHCQGPDLPASLILPMGRNGPAFLAYPNFDVFIEWNQSFTYLTTASYMATRFAGAPAFDPRSPDQGLTKAQLRALQGKLQELGYNVGDIDGILGARSRAAIRMEQRRMGLPADAWPTQELLNRL